MEQLGADVATGLGAKTSPDEPTIANEAKALAEAREHAWRYFTLNADQRLRTFNFYLFAVGLVIGGLLTYQKDTRSPVVVILAGFVLFVLSLVFWLLDCRVKEFIDLGRDIMIGIEQAPSSQIREEFRVFTKQDEKTKKLREKHGEAGLTSWRGHWGFYACFQAAFLIFGSLGAVIFIVGMFLGLVALAFPGSAAPAPPPVPVQNFYISNQPVKPAS